MDAPKCRLCGKRHWSTQQCVGMEKATASIPDKVVANEVEIVANRQETVANKKSRYKDLEKRRIYMKEYMRKKRGG